MIGRLWRPTLRFLGSPKLALVLIIFVGAWSMLATAIPQGEESAPEVAKLLAGGGPMAAVIGALELNQAFTAPVFIAATILLTLSTAVCAWNRTRVALGRAKALRAAATSTRQSLSDKHDLQIACDPALPHSEILTRAASALDELGIKARESEGVLLAVSPSWSVWGSPLFHWALVVLVIVAFVGVLIRSEGSMAIAVGGTKIDQPASYAHVDTGLWYDWARINRSIRVDSFDPGVVKDGIDLGAVPTVSVLDEGGKALVTGQVYPNNKLHSGSLSINAPACGLAVTISLTGPTGNRLPPAVQLVDFSQETSGGTVPVAPMVLSGAAGQVLLRMSATVPLDSSPQGGYGEWIPKSRAANVFIESGTEQTLFEGVIREGETAPLAGGGSITVQEIGWYSRLSLVDDPSIPFVYGSMIAAMLGLTLSLVSRQQLVTATTVGGGYEGLKLVMNVRLWRNVPTSRDEIERMLAAALGNEQEGTVS